MRRLLGTIMQALVDAEATAHIGAAPHERIEARTAQRNGTRDGTLTTTAGDLTVKIPKVRTLPCSTVVALRNVVLAV